MTDEAATDKDKSKGISCCAFEKEENNA